MGIIVKSKPIVVNEAPGTTSQERDVLRRVYEDQLRDYAADYRLAQAAVQDAEAWVQELREAEATLAAARSDLHSLGGSIYALVALAARDGIDLRDWQPDEK